jgi:MerR family transcriptional regulator/heat shock protein HspR
MTEGRYQIVLHHDEPEQLTLEVLAAYAGLPPARVECYVEFGLLEPVSRAESQALFDVAAVPRLRMIERLRRDIGINLAGISVILDMLDRLRALQRENERMRRRL